MRTVFCCAAMVSTPGARPLRTPNGTSRFSSSCSKPSAGGPVMAIVTIPELDRRIEGADQIRRALAPFGIDYERSEPSIPVASDAPAATLLEAYQDTINELNARGGYVTADVIDVFPDTPGLDAMLHKFSSEHWHDEDEVR